MLAFREWLSTYTGRTKVKITFYNTVLWWIKNLQGRQKLHKDRDILINVNDGGVRLESDDRALSNEPKVHRFNQSQSSFSLETF